MALVTVELSGGRPGLARAAKALGVGKEALDAAFGVVPVDRERMLYAVRMRIAEDPQRGEGADRFSDPPIAPMAPAPRP